MSILGILAIYMGTSTKNTFRFKRRKDYTNIFKLDIIITENIRERGDDNLNDFDSNKNYKKIKNFKFNKYYGE